MVHHNSRFSCQQSFYNEYQNNVHPNHSNQRHQNNNSNEPNNVKSNGGVEPFNGSCWPGTQHQNELNSSSSGCILMEINFDIVCSSVKSGIRKSTFPIELPLDLTNMWSMCASLIFRGQIVIIIVFTDIIV